ncbi:MAG: cytochrome P450 [Desulfosarcina sp.]
MTAIPQEGSPDSTLSLATDPYRFIARGCRRHRSDLFQTRLLLHPVICMQGEAAARLFYDIERFSREGIAPAIAKKTLFGEDGIQGLDGDKHRVRKQMFMSLMSDDAIARLTDRFNGEWRRRLAQWASMKKVVLGDEVRQVLFRAVSGWAGVPFDEAEARLRADDLGAMIDGVGSIGVRHWRGRVARRRADRWMTGLIEAVRSGRLAVDKSSVLHRFAMHRESDGSRLDPRVAAVEVINILRPTVAIDRFIIFAALALHQHPFCRQAIKSDLESDLGSNPESGPEGYTYLFVQEVRRFFPFFPFVGAITRRPFEWQRYPFPGRTRVLLDLYGTNHDIRSWKKPDEFIPERFQQWDRGCFNFIPQGGGDHHVNHRCPGEWIVIALMKAAVQRLIGSMHYKVPEQDLRIRMSRLPAIIQSRFVMTDVQPIDE